MGELLPTIRCVLLFLLLGTHQQAEKSSQSYNPVPKIQEAKMISFTILNC